MKRLCLLACFVMIVVSCAKKPVVEVPNDQQLLIYAIRGNNFKLADLYVQKTRLTENSQNIIQFYISLYSENLLTLNNSINYLEQFYSTMSVSQQVLYTEMKNWVYLKDIYRQEISPPVRILQRQKLLLSPSHIDFKKCLKATHDKSCAIAQRNELSKNMSTIQITNKLKEMAMKDPCVNLTAQPRGKDIANLCLQKSTGDLKVSLLPVPYFTYNEWLQLVNNQ